MAATHEHPDKRTELKDRENRPEWWKGRTMAILLLLSLIVVGYGATTVWGRADLPQGGSDQEGSTAETGLPSAAEATTVSLFFTDGQEWALHPEKRIFTSDADVLPEAVIQALLDGPKDQSLLTIMPPGVQLRSVTVTDGVAYVDLSSEVQTNHWGGSASEHTTVYGLVYTLTNLPDIDAVQLLVAGERTEHLLGHVKIDHPLEPILRTGGAPVDRRWARAIQERLLSGEELWRSDPVAVSRFEGQGYGFRPEDSFEPSHVEPGRAEVLATHGGERFRILLEHPVLQGPSAAWAITSVEPLN